LMGRFSWLRSELHNTFAPRDFADLVERLIEPGIELEIRSDGVSPSPVPPAASEAAMMLRIERPATNNLGASAIRKHIGSFEEASREYRAAVDASGEGAWTFPRGLLVCPDGQKFEVSYNGRIWSGSRLVFGPAKSSAAPVEPPTDTIDRSLEEARSAIRSLGLPFKQQVKYLREADEAIVNGKSYLPILERARQAAEKLKAGSKGGKRKSATKALRSSRPRQR